MATAEEIQAQIDKNSAAWHEADDATKSYLENQNKTLYTALDQQQGTTSTLDTTTGTWSSTPATTSQTGVSSGSDFTEYLKDLYSQQTESAVGQITNAYDSTVRTLDQIEADIAPQYDAAKNELYGQSEIAQRNFAEQASSAGLGSGANAQGQLAMNVTAQSGLGSLQVAEQEALNDIEAQRQAAMADYESAIAQAQLEGNSAMAEALYSEAVRMDTVLRNEATQQAAYDREDKLLALETEQTQEQQMQAQQEYYAQIMAQTGDYSGYLSLGWTPVMVQAAEEAYQQLVAQQSVASQTSQSWSYSPKTTYTQTMDLLAQGVVTEDTKAAYQYYTGTPYVESESGSVSDGGTATSQGTTVTPSTTTTPSTSTTTIPWATIAPQDFNLDTALGQASAALNQSLTGQGTANYGKDTLLAFIDGGDMTSANAWITQNYDNLTATQKADLQLALSQRGIGIG